MKKILSFIMLLVFLTSCSSKSLIIGNEKQDFFIQVKEYNQFSTSISFEKTGKIQSGQDIKLTSQANGRIQSIAVKEGTKVSQGQLLVSLSDNVANYGISLERAKNMLEKMEINYDSTKIQLDKQVFDTEINLEKLQNNLATLKKNTEIDINQGENDIKNLDYTNLDSKSALDIQKVDNSIAKAELDYDNVLLNNKETIEGFKANFKSQYTTLNGLVKDILDFSDKIFDFTGIYEDEVRVFKDFLGGNDIQNREDLKILLGQLIDFRDTVLKDMDSVTIDESNIVSKIEVLQKGYEQTDNILDKFQRLFSSSIKSEGQLGQSQIDAYTSIINGYQTQYSSFNNGIVTYKNTVSSFLRTYKNTENSLAKQIELLKKDKDILLKSLEISADKTVSGFDKLITSSADSIASLELQITSVKDTLENAKRQREVTLRALKNSINEAKIGYTSSSKEYSKLSITAPIDGVVGDIFVDKGQDVNNGTIILNIVSNKKTEVEIGVKDTELATINVGMEVSLDFNGKTYTGSIYSISPIADINLSYKTNIIFPQKLDIIGGIAKVTFPIVSSYKVLPINSVTVTNNNRGLIHTFKDGKIVSIEVTLGKVFGDMIEVISSVDKKGVDEKALVILTDVGNYDSEKFILKIGQ